MVNADGLLVEVAFEAGEGVVGPQSGQAVRESVVVEVDGKHDLAQEGGEGALVKLDPRVNVMEAVVALGDHKEQPNGEHFPRRERALPVQRGREMPIQSGRQFQTLQGRPQDRQVGHDFDTEQAGVGWVHPFSLRHPTLRGTGQNTSEP